MFASNDKGKSLSLIHLARSLLLNQCLRLLNRSRKHIRLILNIILWLLPQIKSVFQYYCYNTFLWHHIPLNGIAIYCLGWRKIMSKSRGEHWKITIDSKYDRNKQSNANEQFKNVWFRTWFVVSVPFAAGLFQALYATNMNYVLGNDIHSLSEMWMYWFYSLLLWLEMF